MGYIKNSLADNEELLESFNLNIYVYLPLYFILFFSVAMIVAGIYFGLIGDQNLKLFEIVPYEYSGMFFAGIGTLLTLKTIYSIMVLKSVDMGLTTKRIISKTGVIAINSEELRLEAVENVELKQGAIERLLGYGTVVASGRGTAIVTFKDVDEPLAVKKAIGSRLNIR